MDEIKLGVVLKHADWRARPYTWVAPVHRSEADRKKHEGVVAKALGAECSLLEAAARNAFGAVPLTGLKRIANLLGVNATSTTTFDMLHALMHHILPDMAEDDLLTIMSKRCRSSDRPDDLLNNSEVVEECLDRADAEETEKVAKPTKLTADDNDFLNKWGKARKLTASSMPSTTRKRGQSSSSGSRGGTHMGVNRQYPKKVPGTIVASELQGLLPPACTCWVDRLENRIRAKYDCLDGISRSWAVRGEAAALRMVLEWAWQVHKNLTGEDCPMKDLVVAESA